MAFVVIPITAIFLSLSSAALPRVAVRTDVRVAIAPATIVGTVTMARNDDNRSLTVTLDGPNFYRASAMSVDGANSSDRVQTSVIWHDVPAGDYVVIATLTTVNKGEVYIAVTHLQVTE